MILTILGNLKGKKNTRGFLIFPRDVKMGFEEIHFKFKNDCKLVEKLFI